MGGHQDQSGRFGGRDLKGPARNSINWYEHSSNQQFDSHAEGMCQASLKKENCKKRVNHSKFMKYKFKF
jgi:hypothetical protein